MRPVFLSEGVGGVETVEEKVLFVKADAMLNIGSLEVVIDNLLGRKFSLPLSESRQPEWVFELGFAIGSIGGYLNQGEGSLVHGDDLWFTLPPH